MKSLHKNAAVKIECLAKAADSNRPTAPLARSTRQIAKKPAKRTAGIFARLPLLLHLTVGHSQLY
jgi:hypothetical protein